MWERIGLAACVVVFMLLMLGIAIFIPEVTTFQVFVFRTVLALVAAAAAAFIPGFITVEMGAKAKLWIRAGGAIALFVIVYNVNPPLLVSAPKKNIHEGLIGQLVTHVNSSVTDFSLTLDGNREDELRALYIEETIGDSWSDLLSRICRNHASCLVCDPPAGEIKQEVKLSLKGPPLVNHPGSSSGKIKDCPKPD